MFASGFGASSKILNLDAAGFPTLESSQVLLVSIHNIIYPITEYVLHRVFDPYGYVEKMDILQSSELLQAIVQFGSCQNAIWAKNQLQGRYIYERCCQLDIQFYKKIDNENQTENLLLENAIALYRNFIRNTLHEMMVIIGRMQDRIETMNSAIQKKSHACLMLPAQGCQQQPQGPQSASPATPKLAEKRAPDTKVEGDAKNENESREKGGNSEKDGKNVSSGGRPAKAEDKKDWSAPNSMIPNQGQVASNIHPPPQQNSNQSPLEIYINQLGKVNNDSLHSSNVYNEIKLQFDCQTSFAWIEQFEHILFDIMLERAAKRTFKRKVYIFDPGGILDEKQLGWSLTLRTRSVSEGMVMMWISI